MRMILMLGMMIASLPVASSLFTSEDTEMTRSELLETILEQSLDLLGLSKRSNDATILSGNFECCPTDNYYNYPLGGISRDGRLLKLYRDQKVTQKFYQTSCQPHVKGRRCRFLKVEYEQFSRCTQKYNYVYALVKDYFDSTGRYRLDYIRVNSGCSCELNITDPNISISE